jgi:hypothetical protein
MENKVKKLNIYEKIQAVSLDVNNVSKSMTVGQGNYAYKAVSDLQVTLSVKKSEAEFKIISIPIKQEIIKSEVIKYDKDGVPKIIIIDDIKMTVRFIDMEDTTQFIDVESFGRGLDNGDKGFGKASTYARKYALLNAYKIATGEDPDSIHSEDLLNQLIGKPTKIQEAEKKLRDCKTIDELKTVFQSLPKEIGTTLLSIKDEIKAELTPKKEAE